jgi:hypothetical protein
MHKLINFVVSVVKKRNFLMLDAEVARRGEENY